MNKEQVLGFIKEYYNDEMINHGVSINKLFIHNDKPIIMIHCNISETAYNIGFATVWTLGYLLRKKFNITLKYYDIIRDNHDVEYYINTYNQTKDIAEANVEEDKRYFSTDSYEEINLTENL